MNERNRLRGIGRYWPLALLLGAVVGAVLVVTLASSSSDGRTELSVGRFISEAQAGQVTSAVVDGDTVEFELRGDPGEYETKLEDGDTTREVLVDAGLTPAELEGMDLRVEKNSTQGRLVNLLITFPPSRLCRRYPLLLHLAGKPPI